MDTIIGELIIKYAKPVGNSRVFRRSQRIMSRVCVELGAVGSSSYAGVSVWTDGTGHYTN